MPVVHLHLKRQLAQAERKAIADTIHQVLVEVLWVPEQDHFQTISVHGDDLIYDKNFLDIERTDGIIFVEIVLSYGRPVELKKALFKAITDRLHAAHAIRPEDVFIYLIETNRENISFGNGIAQFADKVPDHLARFANKTA